MTIAAYALFHKDYLELCPLTIPTREPDASSDVVIVTAGSHASSVGFHTIQLASSAGYWVYSMASPEHFETVKKLAMQEDNRTIAGAVAIGVENVETCRRVLRNYKGGNGLRDNNKFIAFTESGMTERSPLGHLSMARRIGLTALRKTLNTIRSRVAGVQIKPIGAKNLSDRTLKNPITRMLFRDFLPHGLAAGHIPLIPEPRVVGEGLEKMQEAFDVLRYSVAAEKVVVSMPYLALVPGRGTFRVANFWRPIRIDLTVYIYVT